MQVAVILKHTGKKHARVVAAVEFIKVLAVKGKRNFLGAVAAEIIKNNAVAVCDFCNRLAVFGNHKGGKILVNAAGFGAIGLNGLLCACKLTADALYMGFPAGFDHGPVGFVAIHGDLHSAAAGSDAVITAVAAQLGKNAFQLIDIFQSGGGGYVTTVQQNMAVDLLHALSLGAAEQGDQVADVGMNVAVGKQTEEMKCLAAADAVGNQLFPCFRGKQCAVFNGFADQLCALRVHLAAAERVMTDLGVAHVIIAGKADCRAVCFEPGIRTGIKKTVERGCFCHCNSIAAAAVTLSDAVHNNQNNGFFHLRYASNIIFLIVFYYIFLNSTIIIFIIYNETGLTREFVSAPLC